ncbi:MAG: hypothetical protein ACR652_20740 [Methylocystis sp.]|uniref:hypothetical protein n=1 Tax=Methylocystis sp. TaxID=1911079 RepID=UPI003DA57D77
MKRNLSGGGVTIAGLLLAGAGAYAMWTGWDMILLERGWSLFISGAAMLSGGVVTMALGCVIAHLARLSTQLQPAAANAPAKAEARGQGAAEAPAARPKPEARSAKQEATPAFAPAALPPKPAEAQTPEPIARPDDAPGLSALFPVVAESGTEEPTEVDRYEAGGATYIMMSDGSVEVRGPNGRQRYPTIAALKADSGLRSN